MCMGVGQPPERGTHRRGGGLSAWRTPMLPSPVAQLPGAPRLGCRFVSPSSIPDAVWLAWACVGLVHTAAAAAWSHRIWRESFSIWRPLKILFCMCFIAFTYMELIIVSFHTEHVASHSLPYRHEFCDLHVVSVLGLAYSRFYFRALMWPIGTFLHSYNNTTSPSQTLLVPSRDNPSPTIVFQIILVIVGLFASHVGFNTFHQSPAVSRFQAQWVCWHMGER